MSTENKDYLAEIENIDGIDDILNFLNEDEPEQEQAKTQTAEPVKDQIPEPIIKQHVELEKEIKKENTPSKTSQEQNNSKKSEQPSRNSRFWRDRPSNDSRRPSAEEMRTREARYDRPERPSRREPVQQQQQQQRPNSFISENGRRLARTDRTISKIFDDLDKYSDTFSYFDNDMLFDEEEEPSSENKSISAEDVIMDVFTVSIVKDGEKEKAADFIVYPLMFPKEASPLPILAYIREPGRDPYLISSSEDNQAVAFKIKNYDFVVRSFWKKGDFKTYLYFIENENENIKIETVSFRPKQELNRSNLGHIVVKESDCDIHVIPLATKNNETTGYSPVIYHVCYSGDMKKVKSEISLNGKIQIGDFNFHAKWENKVLTIFKD